jgi:guanosine-3',5'-bis(diphosphate) 3'-pyrophosphohydrolase
MAINTKGSELLDLTQNELLDRLSDVVRRENGKAWPEVHKAMKRAAEAHLGQKRDDGTPYITHPLRVTLSLALELDVWDADLLCAALLHDAMEDARPLTYADIRNHFGIRVAHIVKVLTKPSNLFLNREQVNRLYFCRLFHADEACKLVKLTDKLDNVRDAVNSPDLTKRRRTAAEARDFYLELARSLSDVQRRQIILALLQDAIKTLEDQTALD